MQTAATEVSTRDKIKERRPKPKQTAVTPDDLFLQCVYRFERERPNEVYMVQPLGEGRVREYSGRTRWARRGASRAGSARSSCRRGAASPSSRRTARTS
ncbi:MAG: hypothetical protein M5U28_48090 [Sandaracinaceae bacterium]|nr:hypothetical protein [Sandaracinaceae bacterium]